MVRFAARVACVAVGVLFAAGVAAAQDDKIKVKVGDKFPVVALKAAQVDKLDGKKAGDTVSIADLKGKSVIVFFYPRALTGGCTREDCGRDIVNPSPVKTDRWSCFPKRSDRKTL